jgi:hypothetical protein
MEWCEALQRLPTTQADEMERQDGTPVAGQLTREAIAISLKDYWLAPTSERMEGCTTKCRLPSPW